MAKNKSKSTAVGVAAFRAIGSRERDPAVRNPDYLAINLVPLSLRTLMKIRPVVWLVLKQYNRILPGGYYFHTARTKHIDAVLKQCAEQGIKQLVILGAGLDSRPYRFRDILTDIKVFEVDYPATQVVKQQKVAALKDSFPWNVTYVPIDLNNQGVDILLEFGYSDALTTLFIWEGVCMYLTSEAVDRVLTFVSHHSGPGSSIVFDYIFQTMVEGKCDCYGARESSAYVVKRDEPYLFGIQEGTIGEFLESRGYHMLSEFTPEMLEQTYLKKSDGKLYGKVYGYTNIVHASK